MVTPVQRWDGLETMESIASVRKDVRKKLKDVDSFKVHGFDEVSPYILKKYAETLDRPHEMFMKVLEEGLVFREWKRANVV